MTLTNDPQPTDPPTELGRLRVLSSTAGVLVSPLALGGGSIGQAWNHFWGIQTKERSFELLDAYFEAGGNFIDTANTYQDGQSEAWIGEWMQSRKIRDRLVIATKYTSNTGMFNYENPGVLKGQMPNHGGNSKRSLHHSIQSSLRRLQTDFIDILYLHFWDYTTSIEEVVDSLHILVQQGKVLYLGISDTPAWIVSAANTYAKAHGKTPFSVYSGKWNVIIRDLEREVIPMARQFGMAITPWGTLGGGKFQTKKMLEEKEKRGEKLRQTGYSPEVQIELSDALAKVGEAHGLESVTCIALAYILRKASLLGMHRVFPVIGGRKVEQLKDNMQALSIKLTEDEVKYLESVHPFKIGWPHDFIGEDPNVAGVHVGLPATSAFVAFPGASSK
ncbi:NADP-dependent oxidoreductase [Podospora fimiseda]|uniref:NADP-dependent oxidoreductase n=1 Tax=Podospora fimiseda TaxID=252190 RepID=A0AAN7BE99_9PEZI|nr:NADP-dependent oxidoreductase [Podospora fimiseda]